MKTTDTGIIGKMFKASVRFDDADGFRETTVKILDKVTVKFQTKYLVEDVDLSSISTGKITTIQPTDIISTT